MTANALHPAPHRQMRTQRLRRQRLVTLLAGLILLSAWLYGYLSQESQVIPALQALLPQAQRFEQRGDLFFAYSEEGLIAYASLSSATGYGGPLQVLVVLNLEGEIIGVHILEHRETPGFFRLLDRSRFLEQFLQRVPSAPLRPGEDLDGVSGATLSAEAVALAVRRAARRVAQEALHLPAPPERAKPQFGIPEATLLALYVVAYFGHRSHRPRLKRWVRRGTLLTGMLVLGFIYNKPLSLANIVSLLAGYWPQWQSGLYWYLLLGGILFVTTAQAKNPYCSWFCPFSAVQESLGGLTEVKTYRPRRLHPQLQWFQRGLAFAAITLGLAFRQPGAVSFAPFSALFDFNALWPQWALLVLTLLASLVIYRPFCSYVCPLAPVVDYIGEVRRWIKDLWQTRRARER